MTTINFNPGGTVTGDIAFSGNITFDNSVSVSGSISGEVSDSILTVANGATSAGTDIGVAMKIFQDENDAGTGDVVTGTLSEQALASIDSSTTQILTSALEYLSADVTVADFFAGWYVKITSGAAINQVRRVTSYTYTPTVQTFTFATPFTASTASCNFKLYGNLYAGVIYKPADEALKLCYVDNELDETKIDTLANIESGVITVNQKDIGGNVLLMRNYYSTLGPNIKIGTFTSNPIYSINEYTTGDEFVLSHVVSFTSDYNGAGGSLVASAYAHKVYKNNNIVNITFPTDLAFTATTTSVVTVSALPTSCRPSTNIKIASIGNVNGTSSFIQIRVQTSGVIRIFPDAGTGGNWTGSCTVSATGLSYSVA